MSGMSAKAKTKGFSGYTYQHYQPMTIEATFLSDKTTPSDDRTKAYQLQLGTQVPNLPFSAGLTYENTKDESDNGLGGTDTDKSTDLTLSATYKLDGAIFLSGGFLQSEYEPAGSPSEDDESFYFGAGYVSETMSGESVFLLSNEPFYLQPSLAYNNSSGTDDLGDKTKLSTVSTDIEAGMRSNLYNVYLAIGLENAEIDNDGSPKIKVEETRFAVGGHFYF